MRRDEQRALSCPGTVFLATMPSAPARDRRRRGAGGGSWHYEAYWLFYLRQQHTSIHLSPSD